MNSYLRALTLGKRALMNLASRKPLCVSFEITHDCNARCRHCHRGGKADTVRAAPEEFGAMYRHLTPPVVQISGGEPLIRRDVGDIIRAIKQPDGTPYIIFVTNVSLLSVGRFHDLREMGVDVFSVSFDYPDERHDEFRNIPGLFNRIRDLVASLGDEASSITLNSVVHSRNFRELPAMAEVARSWGVDINFSPYTWLRTDDMSFVIAGDDLDEFGDIIDRLITFKKKHGVIRTTDSFFHDMRYFFTEHTKPGCRAGERFCVVNPDATLSPCGLIMKQYRSLAEMQEQFSKTNRCASCNTSIRASTERPFNNLIPRAYQTLSA